MISRSSQIGIPSISVEWVDQLCFEMGVKPAFWVERPSKGRLTRRERMTMTLIVLRLRLRHEYCRDDLAGALGMAYSNLHNYEVRGISLLKLDPSMERAFTKMEGSQAAEFLICNWFPIFAVLFDKEEVPE
jgi:hypothetical protein|tara:strand:+ start:333 stop:725 length:393 start_codon:yes stop_codon:yes gene_type:complete